MLINKLFFLLTCLSLTEQSFIRNPFIRPNNTMKMNITNDKYRGCALVEKEQNVLKSQKLNRRDLLTLAQIWFTITMFTFPILSNNDAE
jgi:hypothetical protein